MLGGAAAAIGALRHGSLRCRRATSVGPNVRGLEYRPPLVDLSLLKNSERGG